MPPLLHFLLLLQQVTLEAFLNLLRQTREFSISRNSFCNFFFCSSNFFAALDLLLHVHLHSPLFLHATSSPGRKALPSLGSSSSSLQGFQPGPKLLISCLDFPSSSSLTSKALRTILHSFRRSPACTSHAELLGCHGSSACNATSSTHSTLSRIYTSHPFSHQSRSHSPGLFLHALYPGSTNPSYEFGNHRYPSWNTNREPTKYGQHQHQTVARIATGKPHKHNPQSPCVN